MVIFLQSSEHIIPIWPLSCPVLLRIVIIQSEIPVCGSITIFDVIINVVIFDCDITYIF